VCLKPRRRGFSWASNQTSAPRAWRKDRLLDVAATRKGLRWRPRLRVCAHWRGSERQHAREKVADRASQKLHSSIHFPASYGQGFMRLTGSLSSVHEPWTHGNDGREPRQRPTRLMTREFRLPRPPRRPDFGRSDSVAYEFVQFGRGNREPETFRGARSLDARRDNPRARPRRSARHSAAPPRWPTARDLRARNPLRQNAVRTPQNANAPAVRPGRSLLTCRRASFARAS